MGTGRAAPNVVRMIAAEMLELDRQECLRLLAEQRVGRLAVIAPGGAPMIRPVKYTFDPAAQAITFRTALGSKLHSLLSARQAAFEIDGIDPVSRTGWSVIASGVAEEVVDAEEIDRLEQIATEPWAPGVGHHWIRVRAFTVTGRRIVRSGDTLSGYRV